MALQNGLSPERASFQKRLENGVFSHAYLVEEERGSGKREFALWCAEALLCTGENGKTVPCGVCRACRKVQTGNHPDLHWYGEGEKAISVGDVRSLIRETGLVPADGDRSVYILCHAERMLPAAQNALLKIYEEPPAGVVLFLLTESRQALLPTIRSRGQLLTLSRTPEEELERQLRREFPRSTPEERNAAIRLSMGSPGQASAFFDKDALQNRAKAKEWLLAVFGGDKYRLLALLTVPKYKREGLLPLLDSFLRMLFDLLLCKTGGSPVLLTEEEASELNAHVTRTSLSAMCMHTIICRESIEAYGNLNAGMTRLATELWRDVSGSAKRA